MAGGHAINLDAHAENGVPSPQISTVTTESMCMCTCVSSLYTSAVFFCAWHGPHTLPFWLPLVSCCCCCCWRTYIDRNRSSIFCILKSLRRPATPVGGSVVSSRHVGHGSLPVCSRAQTGLHNRVLKTINPAEPKEINMADISVREYVFFVFFRFQKNMPFYVFLKWRIKKS